MFSSFRNRFGIPGVISVIALVFAMFGGAYAANDSGGDASKATASAKKKGKKAKRGPRGPRGKRGPVGPQGPAGPAGAKGDKGDAGANGSNGANGAKGATGATGPTGPEGPEGLEGAEGSPWTLGGTLPSGETLTGAWTTATGPGNSPPANTLVHLPISFSIPLAAPLAITGIRVRAKDAEPTTECPGTAENPQAAPGFICVYHGTATNAEVLPTGVNGVSKVSSEAVGVDRSGAKLLVFFSGANGSATGTFAVTAP